MNYRNVFHTLGNVIFIEGCILLLPLITAALYGEVKAAQAFALAIAVAIVCGILLTRIKQDAERMQAREAFASVTLCWIGMSVVGAIPYYASGEVTSVVDAFFETVSGFTTTGGTVVSDVEALSHAVLLWRSLTNWLGGMGILVFMLAILPLKSESTLHLFKAESTGPAVSKIVPRMRDGATTLYVIYIVLSIAELVALLLCGMPFFDSLNHMLATAGTGGFSIKNASIGYYGSQSIEAVIAIFMFLFGVNFNIYFLILLGRVRDVIKNTEIRAYILLVIFAIGTISVNVWHVQGSGQVSFLDVMFTVTSIITTTAFNVTDYTLLPGYSQMLLLFLMFTGACAGSTSGGLKLSRFIIIGKAAVSDIQKLVKPRRVRSIRDSGKVVKQETIDAVYSYFVLYGFIYVISLMVISINDLDIMTSISSVLAAMNNVGAAFGDVGAAGSYTGFSVLSKLVLCVDMIAGRLEIFPVIILLMPRTWKKI